MSPSDAPGAVTLDERLERIETKLDLVIGANLDSRLAMVERVVYGGIGVVLLAVLGAVVGLVVHAGKATA